MGLWSFLTGTSDRSEADRVAMIVGGACRYFDGINRARVCGFDPADLSFVGLQRNEFCLVYDQATYYAVRSHHQSVGVGVRVSKNVSLSNRHGFSTDYVGQMSSGQFALTNKRLIFVSIRDSIAINLSDLLALTGDADHIQVASAKRSRVVILQTPWSLIVRAWVTILQRVPLSRPYLPEGLNIVVTRGVAPGTINLSF